jgi:hypothetical protein
MKEEKKKESRVVQVGSKAFNETIIKLNELTTKAKGMEIAKPSGKFLGAIVSAVVKPAVQLYDGFREGFNQQAPKERKSGSMEASE